MTTVGLAIPTIPPREELLERAKVSVRAQTRQFDKVSIVCDNAKQGAAVARNLAWKSLGTVDYVAFLDDDDELEPQHLEMLLDVATETDADLVFPWFTVVGGSDPFPMHFGKEWDPAEPHQTTITVLWRREALEVVGGFEVVTFDAERDEAGNRVGEDYRAVLDLNDMGGKIVHLPERTWLWHHDSGNTSGLPIW